MYRRLRFVSIETLRIHLYVSETLVDVSETLLSFDCFSSILGYLIDSRYMDFSAIIDEHDEAILRLLCREMPILIRMRVKTDSTDVSIQAYVPSENICHENGGRHFSRQMGHWVFL